jgi:hypothetical protein
VNRVIYAINRINQRRYDINGRYQMEGGKN